MVKNFRKNAGVGMSMLAAVVMALTSGCASGGYKLTRQYARWVNSQMIIIRIVLYILTVVVFAVTMVIDLVVFNTVDFWQGKVSQGVFEFEKDGKVYVAQHELQPGTLLKKSTITIFEGAKLDQKVVQVVMLQETTEHHIEMWVDGKLRTVVSDISSLPTAKIFSPTGQLLEQRPLWAELSLQAETLIARAHR